MNKYLGPRLHTNPINFNLIFIIGHLITAACLTRNCASPNWETQSTTISTFPGTSLPKTTRAPVLSPPYYDLGGGNIWMVTWSAPFFDNAGNVKGVATADIAFSQVQEIVNEISVGREGYAFLLDSAGIVLGIGDKCGWDTTSPWLTPC